MKRLEYLITLMLILTSHFAVSQPKPYLQTPTPTSIYISWHSTDTAFTQVRYGSSASACVRKHPANPGCKVRNRLVQLGEYGHAHR